MSARGVRSLPTLIFLSVCLILAGTSCQEEEKASRGKSSPTDIDTALDVFSRGETSQAVDLLQGVVETYEKDAVGDRAALVLGNMLIGMRRYSEALPYLERASAGTVGPEYGKVLVARAVIEGGLQDQYTLAFDRLQEILSATGPGGSPVLEREAQFLLLKLASAQQRWPQAASAGLTFLTRWPKAREIHEARWLTAEAERQAGNAAEAHRLYETTWFDTPRSPWAVQARDRARDLERSAGLAPRTMSSARRFEFISSLGAAGLKSAMKQEIETFLGSHPGDPRTDEVLLTRAQCLYDLRENDACVQTVRDLRSRYPSSNCVPSAVLSAIAALRRTSGNTDAIRQWAEFLKGQYPGSSSAADAMYAYGVHLGNDVSIEQALPVLEQVVGMAGESDVAHDALWKLAWFQRNQGNTAAAVATMRRLLAEHSDTGYKKAALYWIARFTADSDRAGAIELYQQLVREYPQDYYGHRAVENLLALGQQPRQFGNLKPFPAFDKLTDAAAGPPGEGGYARAVNLRAIGLYEFAAAELASVPSAATDPKLRLSLAYLYSRAGQSWEAIDMLVDSYRDFVLSGSRNGDLVPIEFWQILYPYNYKEEIRQAIEETGILKNGIDAHLTAALIRNESKFSPVVTSGVGAIGLMQLMPGTAEQIAKERGLPVPGKADLVNPQTNIRYGTYYLAKMVQRFGGDWFPAICSYNAGPEQVEKWWNAKPADQPVDEFIENIPFQATRNYIKRVLGDYKNYQWIYSQ